MTDDRYVDESVSKADADLIRRGILITPAMSRARSRANYDAMGLPEHLYHLCHVDDSIGGRGSFIGSVEIGTAHDASPEELILLAQHGFGLHLSPVGDFDLRAIAVALPWFTWIAGASRVRGPEEILSAEEFEKLGPPGAGARYRPAGRCLHLEVLETATRLEGLSWHGDNESADDGADLSGLPVLDRVSDTGFVRSALRNPHLRSFDNGMEGGPGDLASDTALEEIILRVPRSFRSMSRFTNLSNLKRLDVRGPASFDLTSIARATALEELTVIECREILGVETLLTLPQLRRVELASPRNMPGLEVLTDLHFNFALSNNYVMSDRQRTQVLATMRPERHAWIGRFKTGKRPFITENTHLTLVDGVDETSFPPFTVTVSDDIDGHFDITFDDWAGLADILLGDQGDSADLDAGIPDEIAHRILAKDAPKLLTSGRIEFDSENEFVRIEARSRADAELTARTLALAWNNRRRMRTLAKGLL